MFKLISTLAILVALSANLLAAPIIATGIGQSQLPDSAAAGQEAALQAHEGMGETPAKIVIVFAARAQLNNQLVEGISEVFDSTIIYGCEGYAPLSQYGNFADQGHEIDAGVTVLALGGEVKVLPVSATTTGLGKHHECGQSIGETLSFACQIESQDKLIVTFGDQHVGDNQPYVDGIHSMIDKTIPIVGSAAGTGEAKEIVRGQIVDHTNVAILICGDFKVQVATHGGGGDLVAKTQSSLDTAFAKIEGMKPQLAFVFNCGGRRGEMVKQKTIAHEFQTLKTGADSCPFFGFYGGGEIGPATTGQPSQGVGFNVAIAALWTE